MWYASLCYQTLFGLRFRFIYLVGDVVDAYYTLETNDRREFETYKRALETYPSPVPLLTASLGNLTACRIGQMECLSVLGT